MSDAPDHLDQDYEVRASDSGPDGSMFLHPLFEVLQEAASSHAEACKAGFIDLSKAGRTWILHRIKVTVDSIPRYHQKIRVHTWACGTQGLSALRDFEVLDAANGTVLARASTSWLLVDINTHRPLKPEVMTTLIPVLEKRALGGNPDKVELPPEAATREKVQAGEPAETFKVRLSDLDMNGHMNNTSYIRMLQDALGPGKPVKSIEVNYLSEALLGDRVEAKFFPVSSGESVVSLGNGGGKEFLRARIAFA